MSEIRDQHCSDLAASSRDAMVPFLGDPDWSTAIKSTASTYTRDTFSPHLPDAATLLADQEISPTVDRVMNPHARSDAGRAKEGETHQGYGADQTLAGLTGRLEAALNAGENRLVVMPMTENYSPDWPISSRSSAEASVHEALRSAFLNVEIVPGKQINQAELDRLPAKPGTNSNYFMVASWKNG